MSVKISELPILSSLADNDVIAGVDTSANVTSKIEMATLKNYIDTNTQYTAGTNIDITNNVISAPDVYNKNEMDNQIEELQNEVDSLSTIFNAFPTESGEGESLTLDDTAEVKFKKFDLKGNTSQTTYSGKNLLNNTLLTTTVTRNGITATPHSDGSITFNGTATVLSFFNLSKQDFGTTSFNSNTGGSATYIASTGRNLLMVYDSQNGYTFIQIYKDTVLNNVVVYPMIRLSSVTDDTYEPYVGGTASPNPSYPQPVNVVSGDNEINVCGKNLLSGSFVMGSITAYGQDDNNTTTRARSEYIEVKENTTYRFSSSNSNIYFVPYFYDSSKTFISYDSGWKAQTNSITTPSNTKYLRIILKNNNTDTITLNEITEPMISTSGGEYIPYQEQNYSVNLGVKNLFDGELEQGSYDGSGAKSLSNINYRNKNIIAVKPNTTYTFSIDGISQKYCTYYYDTNQTLLSMDLALATGTFTTPNNCYYLNFRCFQADYVNNFASLKVQLEEGSEANSYTPYGTTPIELCKIGTYQDYIYKDNGSWYLHKEIGKVVLDGSESGWSYPSANRFNLDNILSEYYKKDAVVTYNSNYYQGYNQTGSNANFNNEVANVDYGFNLSWAANSNTIRFKDTRYTSLNDFTTWLSNNNVSVYYILLTPTNTLIEDTTLIEQLEDIKNANSYKGQTNISQENNDKPFILDVTAIKSLQNVLDRIELLES